MPSSRSPRAITLAPRSWPSRPGLATRTRILGSDIGFHLTTVGKEAHRVTSPAFGRRLGLHSNRLDVQTPPQIPACDGAVRLPAFGDLGHVFRLRQFSLFLVLLNRHLDAVSARRQHHGAAQPKHDKHVRRPHIKTHHLPKMFYY